MKIKKLNENIILPIKKREGDAGFDLYAPLSCIIPPGNMTQIKLGLSVEINTDEVMLIQERSGMALNYHIFTIGNVIDSNYRGEISVMIYNGGPNPVNIVQGERIAQFLILKLGNQEMIESNELSETNRGSNGYGSSGKV